MIPDGKKLSDVHNNIGNILYSTYFLITIFSGLYRRRCTASKQRNLVTKLVTVENILHLPAPMTEGQVMRKPLGDGVAHNIGRSLTSLVPAVPRPLPGQE